MIDKHILADLEEKYADKKNRFDEVLSLLCSKTVKTSYSKGILHDVLPYEHELSGFKVNGKVIENEIMSDNCYRYSYDDMGRVILAENMSSFLGKFYYSEMYFYDDDSITTMYWADNNLYNITLYHMREGRLEDQYVVARYGSSYSKYIYENDLLTSIDEYRDGEKEQKLFYYNKDGNLLKIIRSCANGYTEVVFSTQKIQYKKLEERLYNELLESFSEFALNHVEVIISALAFVVCTGHGYMTVSANMGALDGKEYYPADWSFNVLANLELVRQPLDENEAGHVLEAAVKAADRALMSESFNKIKKDKDFYCTVFEHDEEEIEKKRVNIKKILKDNPYFKITE